MKHAGVIALGAIVVTGGWWGGGERFCALPVLPAAGVSAVMATASAQSQRSFEEVLRDLQSTEPRVRTEAMRSLAVSGYPEAIAPLSALLTDPIDSIQLEAVDTLLDFFLVERMVAKKRVALVLEVRGKSKPEAAFDQGPFVLLPRPVPPELLTGLAGAMRDDNPKVRLAAMYGLGTMARPPVPANVSSVLGAALADPHVDVRLAAARVAGALRTKDVADSLVAAVNDRDKAVKLAAMRALGDVKADGAVQALTEQYNYYRKGDEATAALDGLSRIAHASSVPLFRQELDSRSAVIRRFAVEGLARARGINDPGALQMAAASENDGATRLAFAFALQSVGQPEMAKLVAGLRDNRFQAQAMGYLVELGRPHVPALAVSMQDPDPIIRGRVAETLGLIGGPDAIAALERSVRDPDLEVARAIERGIARARLLSR